MAGVRLRFAVRHEEESIDSIEVPAAVVCVLCGRGDCGGGCLDERTGGSGVMAIVPWERQQASWPTRFFATVEATTRGAEGFFCALPDGAVYPALTFALLAEIFAVSSTALVIAPLAVLGIPGLLLRFLSSGGTRMAVILATIVGITGFTALLVVAHLVHGLALGKMSSRSRAVRMGLYACGWDFGSSPAGALAATVAGGLRSALALLSSSVTAPSRAIDAALSSIYLLDVAGAAAAKRRAMRLALLLSVPSVVVVLALVCLTALFG